MARVTNEGLNGVVGNIIFYIREGRQYARSMPAPKRKKRNYIPPAGATIFGMVSKYGSHMVKNLGSYLSFKFPLATYNSARGWMRNQYVANQDTDWPLSARSGNMCQLNTTLDLRDFLTVDIEVKDDGAGQVEVTVGALNPVRNMKAPANTSEVKIKVITAESPFVLNGSSSAFSSKEEFSFPFINQLLTAKTLVLNTRAKTNDMVVVAIAVEYKVKNLWVTDLQYLPAAIIAMGRMQ